MKKKQPPHRNPTGRNQSNPLGAKHPSPSRAIQVQAANTLSSSHELHRRGDLLNAQVGYRAFLEHFPNHFDALQLMGTLQTQMGNHREAILYFNKAIGQNPTLASVFNNLGSAHLAIKEFNQAIESFDRAVSLEPSFAQAHYNRAYALLSQGHAAQAIAGYQNALSLRPDHAETYNSLGASYHFLENFPTALSHFTRATRIDGSFAQAYFNCARTCRELNLQSNSLLLYDKAIALDVNYLQAYNNKGNLLLDMKRYAQAIQIFKQGLRLNPGAAQLHNNLGNVYRELKSYDEAINSYAAAIQIYPLYAEAQNNLGNTLQDLKRFAEALNHYNLALAHNPQFVDALNNKGVVLRELKELQLALHCYQLAVTLNPQFSQSYFNLGNAYKELGAPELALRYYGQALRIDPTLYSARWGVAMLNIPTLIHNADQIEFSRTHLKEALSTLSLSCADPLFLDAYACVGVHQPFYLAYQERNNRALITQYAEICHTVMLHWQDKHKLGLHTASHSLSARSVRNEVPRIKLGIISDQIRYHSVWNAITKGLVQCIDKEQFEIHIFYLGTLRDNETAFAETTANSFTQNLPSLEDWARAILNTNLDALLYPEIGMHALTLQLAHLRLSPVQMVSWGHPETTGIETIDYFISSEQFEPPSGPSSEPSNEVPNAQSAYSEKLIKLPGLGCTYAQLSISPQPLEWGAYGVLASAVKLLCPGVLYKYAPEYDWTLAAIAKAFQNHSLESKGSFGDKALRMQFIFLYKDTSGRDFFKARLSKAFQSQGLRIDDFVVFIPWLEPQAFYALLQAVDIFLDTLGFSGFNTVMQAVECALPVLTKRGRFLRGRFGSGILEQMGLNKWIASSDQDYVDKAVALATNADMRAQLRRAIIDHRQALFNDTRPVKAFESFLRSACSPAVQTTDNSA